MADHIPGISRTSLWKAWKGVRQELRKCSVRDVVDFIEYDVNPDVWIDRLLRRIRSGRYEPEAPRRFTLAKSKGFSRRMTMPHIPDLALYRAIVDHLYAKFRRFEQKHVYFERGTLPRDKTALKEPTKGTTEDGKESSEADAWPGKGWDHTDPGDSLSGPQSQRTFRAWLRYDQYRKFLIFEQVYPFIVTTDITNFFDSILYCRLTEALHAVSASPRMIGLLFFLLERLSIREAFTESPRIGLPVDEFGCSRKLAHMLLFAHDDRVVRAQGEDAYVRWMDDQNIGVQSYSEGLRTLSFIAESLGRLHLTPNSTKSNVLSIAKARRYFHLDLNKMLDEAEDLKAETNAQRGMLRGVVREIWRSAKRHDGVGHWEKILKRLYRLAAKGRSGLLRRKAVAHALECPLLTGRIADYVRCTGTASAYLDFVEVLWKDQRQVYGDVNRVLVESLLRLEVRGEEAVRARIIGSRLLKNELRFPGAGECAELAPLILLRFGDGRSLTLLKSVFDRNPDKHSIATSRAAAICYASAGPKHANAVRDAASRLLRNHLSDMVKMLDSIEMYDKVPERYSVRIKPSFDPVCNSTFIDIRSLVVARLLSLNKKREVRAWLTKKRTAILAGPIGAFDSAMVRRLWPSFQAPSD